MGKPRWISPEIEVIRRGFQKEPDFFIAHRLRRRTTLGVANKRRRIGLKYTKEILRDLMEKNRYKLDPFEAIF